MRWIGLVAGLIACSSGDPDALPREKPDETGHTDTAGGASDSPQDTAVQGDSAAPSDSGSGSSTTESHDSAPAAPAFPGPPLQHGAPELADTVDVRLLARQLLVNHLTSPDDVVVNDSHLFVLDGNPMLPRVVAFHKSGAKNGPDWQHEGALTGLWVDNGRLYGIENGEDLISWPIDSRGRLGPVDVRSTNPMRSEDLVDLVSDGDTLLLAEADGDITEVHVGIDPFQVGNGYGYTGGTRVALAADRDDVFVASGGEIAVYDRSSRQLDRGLSAAVLGGTSLTQLHIAVDRNFLYVALQYEAKLLVFHKESLRLMTELNVPFPRAIASDDGDVWVVDGQTPAVWRFEVRAN